LSSPIARHLPPHPLSPPFPYTTLFRSNGLRGVNRDILSSGLPIMYLDAYTGMGGDDWKPLYFKNTFWQFNDTLTYNAGRHALKRSEEHTSELQSRVDLVCRLLLEKKNI